MQSDKRLNGGDIFPVVFHDGAVEPATNASLAAFLGGNGKEEYELTEEEKTAKRRQFDKWEPKEIITPMSKAECEAKKETLGIKACNDDVDYWAAAADKCGGVQNLPTRDDLYELAKKVYPSCNDSTKKCTGSPDFSQFPTLVDAGLGTSSIVFWSRSESENAGGNRAYQQQFTPTYSDVGQSKRTASELTKPSSFRAVCVGDLEKQ